MSQFSYTREVQVRNHKRRGESTQGVRTDDSPIIRWSGAPMIGVSSISAASGAMASERHTASPASYWIMPAASNVTMAVTSAKPAHLTMSMGFVNNTRYGYENGAINTIDYPRLARMLRILGLMAVISYMIVILFTWIYANIQGYVYFSAGEPLLMIKYPEWVLGVIGIFASIDLLRKELDDEANSKKLL